MLPHLLQRLNRKQPLLLFVVAVLSIFALFWPHAQPEPSATTLEQVSPPPVPVPIPNQEAQDQATTVLELFNPSDQSLTHQLNETNVSQQIEQAMATSYILSHCKLMTDDEYRNNFRALIVLAQHDGLASDAVTAEALVRKIAVSAGASYSLLYSRTDCANPQLPAIHRQMINWQKIYLHE